MLKERALKATLWSGLDMFLRQGLGFIVSIILARLIAPEQFGIIALLSLFISVANVFVDGGFAAALIQRQSTNPTEESTVFWLNVGIGTLASALLIVASPLMAAFFRQPVLVPLILLLAPTVVIGSLGTIHTTLMTRDLDFRTQIKISSSSMIVASVVGIALAWRGHGVWALAWQQLAGVSVTVLLLWVLHPWRPKALFSIRAVRSLFGFGGYLFGTTLLDHTYNQVYTILIGKLFGVRELGFYNRASSTQQTPSGVLNAIFWRVALPVFSVAKDDKARLRRGVRLAMRGMMLINVPAMLGLAAVSGPLVVALFGARWAPAAPILEVLCLAGVLWPMHAVNVNVLMAQGHAKLFFKLQVIKQGVGIALAIAGSTFGVLGIAWSMVLYSVIAFFVNSFYTRRHLNYGSLQQLLDVMPIMALSTMMWLCVRFVAEMLNSESLFALLSEIVIGVSFMLFGVVVLRFRAFREALELFRQSKQVTAPITNAMT